MGAKLVPDFMKNVTPAEAFELLEFNKLTGFQDRARGLGRPTKKNEETWMTSLLMEILIGMI